MAFSAKIAVLGLCLMLLASTAVVFAQTSTAPVNYTSPTTANLNSVAIVSNQTTVSNATLSAYNAWAVGDNGTILQWNRNNWTKIAAPNNITDNLYQVIFVNETSGWAVGGNGNRGVILNYNGTGWNQWTNISYRNATSLGGRNDTVNATLYSVVTNTDGTAGWIVGAGGNVLTFNGTYWIGATNQSTNTLRSVAMIHGDDDVAWACGDNGTILMWTGSAWTRMNTNTTTTLRSIIVSNTTSGWAVGGDNNNGTILMLNGTSWSPFTNIDFARNMTNASNATANDKINATLYSLTMTDVNVAWAVGGNGTVLFWDGTQWSGQTGVANNTDLRGIFVLHALASPESIAWAVGTGGTIIGWTGAQWIPEFSAVTVAVLAGTAAIVLVGLKAKRKRVA